jgi:predicted cupin superfamily sugar epimerase
MDTMHLCLPLAGLAPLLGAALPAAPIGMAARLIRQFKLTRIPDEGCWFTLTYRSADLVTGPALPARYRGAPHVAASAIYALETRDDFSAMHRVRTDELWHYHDGDPLQLLLLHPDGRGEIRVLGPDVFHGQQPQIVVPGGTWQGSRPLRDSPEAYTFFGNTLAPGFEAADFEIGYREELQQAYPAFAALIAELTRAEFVTRRPVTRRPVAAAPSPARPDRDPGAVAAPSAPSAPSATTEADPSSAADSRSLR